MSTLPRETLNSPVLIASVIADLVVAKTNKKESDYRRVMMFSTSSIAPPTEEPTTKLDEQRFNEAMAKYHASLASFERKQKVL